MVAERWRPMLCRDYTACARGHALDLAASCLVYVSASVMADRVWRFPFDDEIYTFRVIERFSALKLLRVYPSGSDVHPPLSYILFRVLQDFGFSEPAMRLCSLAMTASALALLHLLALTLMARRNGGTVAAPSRLIAVLLFGLSALAVSQGDAIRWYPLFAVLIALFVTLYVFAGNGAARRGRAARACVIDELSRDPRDPAVAARPLRLAAEVLSGLRSGFLAGGGAVCGFEFPLGLFAGISPFCRGRKSGPGSIVQAALTDLLGFFGGATLGISQAWIVVPAIAIAAMAMAARVERQQPASPVHLLLLMLAADALMAVVGFAKPRSFLYLTPILAGL